MRLNFSFLLVLLFVIFSSYSHAQITLSGSVLEEGNTPISFANVVLTDPESNVFIAGTITNEDGNFQVVSAETKPVKITISFVGFESWSTIVDESQELKSITLYLDKNNLEEVVLTGKKSAISKKGNQLLFNVQNTSLKTGYDGLEVLGVTPNVWVDENGSILMKDSAARVLINGRRITMSGSELSNYISTLTSENILRIEVQTNQSANTSAQSTGGLINIILKKQPLGVRGQFKSYYANRGGGYDIRYAGFNASYGSEKWNLYGSYNVNRNETFDRISNNVNFFETSRTNRTIRENGRTGIRQNYRFGVLTSLYKSHEIGIEVFGTNLGQEYDDLGAVSYLENGQIVDLGRNDIRGNTNRKRLNGVLNYKWNINPNSKLTVFVDYLRSNNDGQSTVDNVYQNETVPNSLNRYTPNSETDVYAFQADYSKELKNEIDVDFGVKYTQSDRFNSLLSELRNETGFSINPLETTNFNYQENVSAGYLSASKTLNEKNYFKLGLRVENTVVNKVDFVDDSRVDQDYLNWFPSLYYSRTLGEKKSISVSYSRSLRRPSFNDLSDRIIKVNDFQFILGNPALSPEFVQMGEVSYDFNQSGVSAYYKNTNDAINGIYFIENEVAFYKRFNAGSQVQYGLQFNTSKKITDWWNIRFSSHFFNRKFINELGESSFEKITVGARLFNAFTINKTMSVDFSGRYVSPIADAFYEAAEVYTANITFKKSFLDKKLNLRISLDDIFNSLRYQNVRQFDVFSTNADSKPRSRKIMFWLTYNFSNNKKVSSKKNRSKNAATNRL
jgi:outer membrane receptor protein involved in Fe transport